MKPEHVLKREDCEAEVAASFMYWNGSLSEPEDDEVTAELETGRGDVSLSRSLSGSSSLSPTGRIQDHDMYLRRLDLGRTDAAYMALTWEDKQCTLEELPWGLYKPVEDTDSDTGSDGGGPQTVDGITYY